MRKSYLLIALILLLVGVVSSAGVWKIPSSTAEAHMMLPVAGSGATGGGGDACDTLVAENTATTASYVDIGDGASTYFVGHHFLDEGDGHDICKITLNMSLSSGDISGKTFTCYVYTIDGSGNLDTLQGTSEGISGNNSWDESDVEFTFSSAVSFGLDYAVVVSMGETDGSNYARMNYSSSGQLQGLMGRWESDLSRSSSGANDGKLAIYE